MSPTPLSRRRRSSLVNPSRARVGITSNRPKITTKNYLIVQEKVKINIEIFRTQKSESNPEVGFLHISVQRCDIHLDAVCSQQTPYTVNGY